MSKNNAVDSQVLLRGIFAILLAVPCIVSCGGSTGTPNTTSVSASATPVLVADNTASTIIWSSANSTSCTSSPSGINATKGSYVTPLLTATTTYTITCTGPTGSASKNVTISVAPSYIVTPINKAAACVDYPMLTGKIYYYCDCGKGAETGCVAGKDTNDGIGPSTPKQTIGDAATRMRTQLAANDTVALCKGGAFDATGRLSIGSNRCPTGTACNDLREYSPTFGGTAKPLINNPAGAATLFSFMGNVGGVRLLNLKLQGVNGPYGTDNEAFFFYSGAHDVTMCNLEMDSFDLPINLNGGNATVPSNPNIKLTGSKITNSQVIGYLGAGLNAEVSYNYWDGNGGSNMFDHTIYLGSGELTASNVKVVGNYIHGQYGPTCKGVVIVGHGRFDNLTVSNNYVEIDAAAGSGGCYGIGFGSGGYTTSTYFRHATFSGNTLKNTGNAALVVASCPDCVIENNLIIQDWDYTYPTTGIVAPAETARVSPADDVSDRNIIRNNTIWFGPKHVHGALGIKVGAEGTGHVIANNTVTYSSDLTVNTWGGVNCFDYPLTAPGSYLFINNNHCYSAAAFSWVTGHGSLGNWTATNGQGFDTVSITAVPNFTAVDGTDFTPAASSPLVGAGDATYGSTHDITGKARPTLPAIGAYEH